MDEAFLAGETFDEGAELLSGADDALVGLTFFDLGSDHFDFLDGAGHAFAVGGEDVDLTAVVFGDVDLRAGDLGDALDVLAAGADEHADLFRIDLEGLDARGVLLELAGGSGDGSGHDFEDLFASDLVTLDRFLGDFEGQTVDLEVELEASDAFARAADLEVHVAEVVLGAEDVGQDDVLVDLTAVVSLGDEAAGDAGDGGGDRHAGVHQGEGTATDGGHGGRAVGLHDVGDHADGVGELVLGREHGQERTLGQGTVTDLAASGAGEAATLANGEGREVVVQDERLRAGTAGEAVEILGVAGGAEGDVNHALGFTALEEGGAVNAREHVGFAGDVAQIFGSAAIDALAGLEDVLAIDFFLKNFEGHADLVFVELVFADLFLHVLGAGFLEGVHSGLAVLLLVLEDGFGELAGGLFAAHVEDFGLGIVQLEFLLGLGHLGGEVLLGGDEGLDGLVGELQGLDKAFVADLVSGTFDHHHFLLVADIDEVEGGLEHLLVGRVDHELAVDFTEADTADGTVPGDVGAHDGGGGAVDHEHVGLVDQVGGHEDTDDLHFVEEALREERTQGAVAQARGEDFLFGGTSFTLKVPARETPGGGELFAVVNGQGEKVLTGPHGGSGGSADENRGFPQGDGDGAAGLLGDGAGRDIDSEVTGGDRIFLLHRMLFDYGICRGRVGRRRAGMTLRVCRGFLHAHAHEAGPKLDNKKPPEHVLGGLAALAAQFEATDDLVVFVELGTLQVVKELSAARGHRDQPAARVEVFPVRAQVVGEVGDPGGQKRDLHFA